jgi:hypothetical protein
MKTSMPQAIDPAKRLALLARDCFALGIISVAFGLVILVGYGYFNRLTQFRLAFQLMGTIVWVLPGTALIIAGVFLRQRRWGIIVGLISVLIQALMAAALFAANFVLTPISVVPVVMSGIWLLALASKVPDFRRAFGWLQSTTGTVHGFEVIAPKAVLPALPVDSAPAVIGATGINR